MIRDIRLQLPQGVFLNIQFARKLGDLRLLLLLILLNVLQSYMQMMQVTVYFEECQEGWKSHRCGHCGS
jgi:hypothetical protein